MKLTPNFFSVIAIFPAPLSDERSKHVVGFPQWHALRSENATNDL